MSALVNNFCKYYNKIVIEVKEKFCEDSSKCKNIELAFKQWANMELFNVYIYIYIYRMDLPKILFTTLQDILSSSNIMMIIS